MLIVVYYWLFLFFCFYPKDSTTYYEQALEEFTMAAEKLLADANELMLDDQYDKALKILSEAVDLCNNEQNANVLIQIYVRRSECYVKLKKFKEALDDAQLAVDTNGADLRGYLKKGYSLSRFFHTRLFTLIFR